MRRSDRWLAFIQTLKIRARDRRIIPLRLNYPQQRLWQIVAPKIDRLEPIRVIVLKFRRGGVSTGVEALLTAFCCSGDNVQALVTAHMKKPAGEIWGMSKRFVTTSPLLSGVATIGNNAISFGRSTLKIATAGSPESERGGDLTACHFSEAGFYPHPGFLTAAMQALPHSKKIFSIGIIESTANTMDGDGEDFYNEWTRAEEGESEWVPLFLGTHEFPDYQIEGAILEPPFSPEEYALRERFEVTDAHLAWRRWCIANNCKGDVSLYHQEYPYTAEEAFVQSGLAFFSPEQLLPMEKALRKGVKGEVDSDGHFTRRDDGPMEIFVFPQPGHTYVVGADSSMGIPDQEGKREHSRSGAEVMDMETMEQVAEFDAASPPHLFARHLVGIGRMYNNALLAPEVQASGGGGGREVLVYIRDMGYWNIHQWRGDPDRIRRSDAILYGWETTSKTRPRMLARIREVVMERSSVIHSRRLYKQLSAFGESDSGRAEALSGRDDLLFAYGIALMSRSENYWKATSTPVSTSTEVNWEGLGIHVKHQEDLSSRLRRLMTQPGPDDEKRSFLEL